MIIRVDSAELAELVHEKMVERGFNVDFTKLNSVIKFR